ncbi:hypothetical protein TNCV_3740951 [Trichonephila clavipes]|nr:hypothetical protein TNCV_3740951 [Trichonephila clavipes]
MNGGPGQRNGVTLCLLTKFSLHIELLIILNCFLRLLVLPIYRQSKTCVPCLRNDWTRDTPPAATPDQLWQYVEAAWTVVRRDSMPRLCCSLILCRGVWQWF